MIDFAGLEPGQAVMVDWTAEEYHADRQALTRSSLGLMPDNPHAMRKWLDGESEESKSSRSQGLGTLTHMAMLEPDEFMARVLPAVERPYNANGRAAVGTPGRVAWEAWQQWLVVEAQTLLDNPSALSVNAEDRLLLLGMMTAINAHPEASAVLRAEGQCEQTIVWREPTTGLLAKVRVDKLVTLRRRDVFGSALEAGDYAADLKTTDDDAPRPFSKSGWRYGYLPQAALYTDAVEALLGRVPTWLFIAVTSSPVEEQSHGVSVYTLTDEQLARGRETYRAQMVAVMERQELNDWTPSHRRGVNTLPM